MHSPKSDQTISNIENAYRKLKSEILPLLILGLVFAYVSRTNISFAKLQMKDDLLFSEATYGMGAGIFFIGYVLFEVPSNLILYKIGARIWMARIMITWGLVSAAMIFVATPPNFTLSDSCLVLLKRDFSQA